MSENQQFSSKNLKLTPINPYLQQHTRDTLSIIIYLTWYFEPNSRNDRVQVRKDTFLWMQHYAQLAQS